VKSPIRRDAFGRIWTIARRELNALLDHPTGYVLLIVFIAINAFLFFRQAFLTSAASLRPMVDLLPWVFLFIVPAVSMRTLAEDSRGGVLEVVLTQPITELELIIGKFLGAMLFLWIGLALTLAIPLGLSVGADLRVGPIVAQYVGMALLACGLTGVGVWASSLAKSQITAFIIAVAVMFMLVLVGLDPLLVGLPPTAAAVAARLGVLSHFESLGRGVIDLRDVIYFVSLAGIFLLFAYSVIVGRKVSPTGAARRRLRTGSLAATATVFVVNLLGGYIGGRIDLSPGKAYTLSRPTKEMARNLDDLVTIKLFASDELPTEVALLRRQVDDLLRDLRASSRGKIRVVRRNTTGDETAERDAQTAGVQRMQFNVIGSAELSVKEGYFGLTVQYGAGSEVIPFINRTDDLEFRLVSAIRSLTRPAKPVVGVVTGSQNARGFTALRGELAKSYEVRDIALTDSAQPAADVVALMLAGTPESLSPDAAERIRAYLKRGGGAFVLANGVELNPNPQLPFAMPRDVVWNQILGDFGVTVKSDVVYDLAANEVIPTRGSGPFQVLRRYPFFVRAGSTAQSSVNKDLTNALLPWPSSIDTASKAGLTITPLFVTTRASGVSVGETMIDPSRDYPQTDLAPRLVAVQITPSADTAKTGRLIVVGNAEFISDNFAQHATENLAFALNSIDWLAQDPALIAIRSKDTRPPALAFTSAVTRDAVKYGNLIGVPALVAILGALRLMRRKRKSRSPYRVGDVVAHAQEVTA
jgi:ABC-type uncharacterized transport system involved in gliding motility auxiliary subunit/ABC-type transport system involved in multi-copper enzyme maturation permease subunit